jgi:hypothetical protein
MKVNEEMTVCQHPPCSSKLGWTWSETDRYICHFENLELYPEGKFIYEWIDSFGENVYHKSIPVKEPQQLKIFV